MGAIGDRPHNFEYWSRDVDDTQLNARFEKTGHLGVQPGRGRKSTRSDVVEDVATTIVDQSMDNVIGCSSARAVS
ncbi:DUF4817 domain-containing protein [Trichonephila clavipes]|nr:DUF4817 domain-containing protein [Trichonephila clavipes]